jgi:hypothetical protein
MDLSHLRGLRRLSSCCEARVGHPFALRITELDGQEVDPIHMICLKCRLPVKEHILINDRGNQVWPVDVTGLPPLPKRTRRRRVSEADPIPYPLHLQDGLAILRRKR